MKYVQLLILYFSLLSLSAQSFEYYLLSNYDQHVFIDPITLPNNDFLITVFEYRSGVQNPPHTVLFRIDPFGNPMDSAIYNFYMHPYLLDSTLYFFGDQKDTVGYQRVSGVIDHTSLDIVSTKHYQSQDTGFYSVWKMDYLESRGSFFVMSKKDSANSTFALIMQIDTNLNVIHQVKFSKPDSSAITVQGVFENPAQDSLVFLISSFRPDDTLQDHYPGALLYMDSSLTPDTARIIELVSDSLDYFNDSLFIDDFPTSGLKLTDSTYLFSAMLYNSQVKNHTQLYMETDHIYAITDKNFKPKKWVYFGKLDTFEMSLYKACDKFQNHAYIGYITDFIPSVYYPNMFGLRKIDLQGNEIWTKFYSNGRYNEGGAIMATKDGGALIVSKSFNLSKWMFEIYILKVDSNGGSPVTVGINERKANDKFDYSIYPNPAKDQLNFQKFNYFTPYKVRLFDAFGREVMRFEWIEDLKTIPIADLAPGVYIYRISDENGRMSSGKIVVE